MILREKPGKPTVHAVSKIGDFLGCRKLLRSFRIQRGGNWNNGANAGALSVNLNNAPSNTNSNIGFRCTSQFRSLKCDAAGSSELLAFGGGAEFWGAHRLASYEVTGLVSVLPAQFSVANISQHPTMWCLQCQVTASTDDQNKTGGEAGAW